MRRRNRAVNETQQPAAKPSPPPLPKLYTLKPAEWVSGIRDPHWVYELAVKQADEEMNYYRCRFSVLHAMYATLMRLYQLRNQLNDDKAATGGEIYNIPSREPPPAFPSKHWLPLVGKYLDFDSSAMARANSIFETMLFFEKQPETRRQLHELVRALPEINGDCY